MFHEGRACYDLDKVYYIPVCELAASPGAGVVESQAEFTERAKPVEQEIMRILVTHTDYGFNREHVKEILNEQTENPVKARKQAAENAARQFEADVAQNPASAKSKKHFMDMQFGLLPDKSRYDSIGYHSVVQMLKYWLRYIRVYIV